MITSDINAAIGEINGKYLYLNLFLWIRGDLHVHTCSKCISQVLTIKANRTELHVDIR